MLDLPRLFMIGLASVGFAALLGASFGVNTPQFAETRFDGMNAAPYLEIHRTGTRLDRAIFRPEEVAKHIGGYQVASLKVSNNIVTVTFERTRK